MAELAHESKQVSLRKPRLRRIQRAQTRVGRLTSEQMKRLGNQGIPGICKSTIIDQSVAGLSWEILSAAGERDAQTEYYTMLVHNANDGEGAAPFFDRLCSNILLTLEGGFFEIVPTEDGIPIALYNVDSTTISPTDPEEHPDEPWKQKYSGDAEIVYFRRNELAQILWHPYTDIGYSYLNRTPVELAYSYITILAAADDWNFDLLADPFPAGVLSLPGASAEEATSFKEAWEFAIAGGSLRDIAVIYGADLKQAQHIKFTRPPTDMAFEITNHWYASLCAAAFEMSILDISILTKVSTKAGAESQERTSAQQGQRKLRKVVEESVEAYLLPEGYNFRWIVPKPEDEATQAEAMERKARAVNYFVMALGPEAGYQAAIDEGIITPASQPKRPEHIKSRLADVVIQADLRGAISLAEWESIEGELSVWAASRPPEHLWGEELYEWALDNYTLELQEGLELWMSEVEEDEEMAVLSFREKYRDSLRRSATRAYVAGKQQEEAKDWKEAAAIALVALAAWELMKIQETIREDEGYFENFARTLREEGEDYTRAEWRTSLYPRVLRKFYDWGRLSWADRAVDMIEILEGPTDHCEICPTMWNRLITFEEYEALGGHPSAWCAGNHKCGCVPTLRRAKRIE